MQTSGFDRKISDASFTSATSLTTTTRRTDDASQCAPGRTKRFATGSSGAGRVWEGRGILFLFLGNYLPFIVSISGGAKVAALPWFDLNLNFGASYIRRVGPYTPAYQQPLVILSLSRFLRLSRARDFPLPFFLFLPRSLSPSTPTFIQWITSLVATFRGLLIPAGQIIQIGLLRSCPNLMSVMLLYPLHTRPPSHLSSLTPLVFSFSFSRSYSFYRSLFRYHTAVYFSHTNVHTEPSDFQIASDIARSKYRSKAIIIRRRIFASSDSPLTRRKSGF